MMEALSAPADLWATAGRLGLAALAGAAIGFNRELQQKPAGLRTHALVSLASALATMIGLSLTLSVNDPSSTGRIIQGVIAGVGFIGAGVIMVREDEKEAYGLTTAATIWVVSILGVAAGGGQWRTALIAVGLALIILTAGRFVDNLIHKVRS